MMGCDMIERLMRPRRFRCLTLFLAAALWSPAAARAQQEAVRVGYVPIISNAGVYIAIERGYFREQGIGNEMSTFASAAKMLSALTVGELDVSLGAASAGLFTARCEIWAHPATTTRSPRGERERGGGPPLSVGLAGRAGRLRLSLQAPAPSPRTRRCGGWSTQVPQR